MAHTQAELDTANRHIAEADARISRHQELIKKCHAVGFDTLLATETLRIMREIRIEMIKHRRMIAADMAPVQASRLALTHARTQPHKAPSGERLL